MTPFEIFRTPIQILRYSQGFYLSGRWQEGSQVTLSTVLTAGNVVNITLNGIALAPVSFAVSAAATMAAIAAEILAQPNIANVDISSNNLVLTVVPVPPNQSVVNSFVISGGTPPIVTIKNSPTIIPATASIQPSAGIEVALIPEARRDKETYIMFTSTQIFGITTQNPDQVTVLKGPFTGIVFEVVSIDDWQNNSIFTNVNHYKYLCLRLNPLPNPGLNVN